MLKIIFLLYCLSIRFAVRTNTDITVALKALAFSPAIKLYRNKTRIIKIKVTSLKILKSLPAALEGLRMKFKKTVARYIKKVI